MPRLVDQKYRALFVVLIAFVVLVPALRAGGARVALDFLISLVFLVTILSVFTDRRLRAVAVVLGLPTLVGVWTGYLLPEVARVPLAVVFHGLATAFFGLTIAVVLRDIRRERGVSADGVYGAFCGYLLAGLAFGHVFCVVERLQPGSFGGEGFAPPHPDDLHFLLTYFSFITLSTIGYGDITPRTDTARGLVVVEAIVGQFYLAVLVAELIGRRVSQAFAPPEPDADRKDRVG